MCLEDLRKQLEPMESPSNKKGVSNFFETLNAVLGNIVPEACGDHPLSNRQYCVYQNALRLFCAYNESKNIEALKQCVCEVYDFTQNYSDTSHEISLAELLALRTVLFLYVVYGGGKIDFKF